MLRGKSFPTARHPEEFTLRIFSSPTGPGSLWFDNLAAMDGTPVAYDPIARQFRTERRFCANRDVIGCNWLRSDNGPLCQACAMTRVVPDPAIANSRANWAVTEAAKRWVLNNLGRWNWFRADDAGTHPVFHLLAEGVTPVSMGHAGGVITISIAEADPVVRVRRREALDEPYRTMIGHMRHELAHLLWWRLSINQSFLDSFRTMFGDERKDYQAALTQHYREGPPAGYEEQYVTGYASAHPHEDWAETAAHLLNLTDIADSFVATGLRSPNLPEPDWNPYAELDAAKLIAAATSITIAVNHINRSMGRPDLYPFVIRSAAFRKLSFVHHWLRGGPQGIPSAVPRQAVEMLSQRASGPNAP